MRRSRGFTMVELSVTIVVAALLLAVVLPNLGTTLSNSRSRTVVSKFTQDFASLRNSAATGSPTVTLTLNADCTWSAAVAGVADTSRSMSAQPSTAGLSCSGLTGTALPVTFNFSPQGFVQPSASFVFTAGTGQSWPMQVLSSGTVAIITGAQ